MNQAKANVFVPIAALILVGVLGYLAYDRFAERDPGEGAPREVTGENSSDEGGLGPFEDLSLQYVEAVDWPPTLNYVPEAYGCTEAGGLGERAGITEEREIGGRLFCVTEVRNGAAGSIYSQYAYAFDAGRGKTAILTFSIRRVQCANYEEREAEACESEQDSFSVDELAANIAKTFQAAE